MNWYAKYKQARALPETTEPYPTNQTSGLWDVDSYLTEEQAKDLTENKPVEYLGAGSYGAAWLSGDKVKKITTDKQEYDTAQKILLEQQRQGKILPFVIPVYSARKINEKLSEIIIGKAKPLDKKEERIFMLFYFKNKGHEISEQNFKEYDQQKVTNMRILTNNLFNELKINNIEDVDIHCGNVGIYNDRLVIIDLGAIVLL